MAGSEHQGAGAVYQRGGVRLRAGAVVALFAAASLGTAPSAVAAASDCAEGACPVTVEVTKSEKSTATTTTTSTSTSTVTTTTTASSTEEAGTIFLDNATGTPSADVRPTVVSEAQRVAQIAAGIRRDIYQGIPQIGCGGAVPAAPCPEPEQAGTTPAVQQAGMTTTATTTTARTNTTRQTRVSVQELAVRAKGKIKLPKPQIGSAPCTTEGCVGRVGVPVWMWTQELPTESASASAGGRTVKVSSKISKVTWDLGDGRTITCAGSGTPYKESKGWATSPDCGVPGGYTKMGHYNVTATFHHQVSYEGVDLPDEAVTSSTSTRVAIGEVQVLVN